MTRFSVTGLEAGRKRFLVWLEGELSGDEDLKTRFLDLWNAVDHQAYEAAQPEHNRPYWQDRLTRDLLGQIFAETLDFRIDQVSTPERLQEWANAWNAHPNPTRHWTAQDMQKIEEENNERHHRGPPYSWEEILKSQRRKGQPKAPILLYLPSKEPGDAPKCLECLKPMEWIWYCSSPRTWKMLGGSAGWTAICRKCKTWRRCQEQIIN